MGVSAASCNQRAGAIRLSSSTPVGEKCAVLTQTSLCASRSCGHVRPLGSSLIERAAGGTQPAPDWIEAERREH